jgi:acetyl esterase/lipase
MSLNNLTYLLLIIILVFPDPGFCQQEVPLYDIVPNSKSNNLQENILYDDQGNVQRVSSVLNPRLIVFSPKNPCGTGIIICPGGGYKGLNIENARFIAERLNQAGITAFILIYRLPSAQLQEDPSVSCLQDVQEAFRLVRRQAHSWGLSPDKTGLMGSSAGGHLAAMAATHYHIAYEKDKATDGLRPDFLVLAWPVISFRPGYIYKGLIELLLG